MKIGYARVSTEEQNLDMQLTALRKAKCTKIYEEKQSGANRNRVELNKMLETLRPGDVVVVWKLDRLARSTRILLELLEEIIDADAKFVSLSEPWADTTSPAGKMIVTVLSGMAEFERDLIRERTKTGRLAAIERGVKFGRPKKLTPAEKKQVKRRRENGESIRDIADYFNVHFTTIYRALEE